MGPLSRREKAIEVLRKVFVVLLFVAAVVFVFWLIDRDTAASNPLAEAQPKPLISPWEPLP